MEIEKIRAMVKEAMAAKDAEYQLIEVVRSCVEAAHIECFKIAQEKQSFSTMPNPSDLDRGWKRCAKAIADQIREVAGLKIILRG
jgi:hypothetical protein